MRARSCVLLLPLLMVLAVTHGPTTATAAGPSAALARPVAQGCPGNLLANPGFDGGSRKTQAEGTSLSSAVADGWFPWFVRGDASSNREPEFKVEQVAIGGDPFRVRSGGQSMKWFTTWATHTAGVYQRVPVRPGSRVAFSIHGMIYSGEADGWSDAQGTFLSDPEQPGNYRIWAGIDPTGAIPPGVGAPPPESVVWSTPGTATDTWVRLEVAATAREGAVTVYAKGAPEWPVKHNDSFWEDACLQVTRAAPAPRPEATDDDDAATGASGARRTVDAAAQIEAYPAPMAHPEPPQTGTPVARRVGGGWAVAR